MLTNRRSYNNDDNLRENSDSLRHNMQNDHYNYERFERHKTDPIINLENSSRMRNNEKGTKISDTNNFDLNDGSVERNNHIDEYNHERYQRNNLTRDQKPNTGNFSGSQINSENTKTFEPNDTSNLRTSSKREEWSDLGNKTLENGLEEYRATDRLYASTPRFEIGDEFEGNPNLSLSTVSFSYKSSPTRRKPRKRNPEEMIW
jgi:hypothetical protein